MSLTLAVIHEYLYKKADACCNNHIKHLLKIGIDGYEQHVQLKRKRLRELIMNDMSTYEKELNVRINHTELILQKDESLEMKVKTYKIDVLKTKLNMEAERHPLCSMMLSDLEKLNKRDYQLKMSMRNSSKSLWVDVAKKIETERARLKQSFQYSSLHDFTIDDSTSLNEYPQFFIDEKEAHNEQEQVLSTISHRETALSYLKYVKDTINVRPILSRSSAEEDTSTEEDLTIENKLRLACEAYAKFLSIHFQNDKIRKTINLDSDEHASIVQQLELEKYKTELGRAQKDLSYCEHLAAKFLDDSSNLLPTINK